MGHPKEAEPIAHLCFSENVTESHFLTVLFTGRFHLDRL